MLSNTAMRGLRLAIGSIMPPVVALLVVLTAELLATAAGGGNVKARISGTMADFGRYVFVAYYYFGIQSILYSLVMEFLVRSFIPFRWLAIVISAGLGAASGLAISLSGLFSLDLDLVLLGAIACAITGALLRSKAIDPSVKPIE